MRNATLSVVLVFVTLGASYGQSITPQVVNSTGGTFKNPYYTIDWSVGELALIDMMQSTSNYVFTNGFMQPFTQDPSHIDYNNPFADDEIFIFPNPTHGKFEVDFRTKQKGVVRLVVYDAQGHKIYAVQFNSFGTEHLEKIDLTQFPVGAYMMSVELRPASGSLRKSGSFKILKVR